MNIIVVYTAEPCAMPEQSPETIFLLSWFTFSFVFDYTKYSVVIYSHVHSLLSCTLCRKQYLNVDNG